MANFHAADLWVAVVPDTSKVGPAMEQAGKESKTKFGDGVKGIGKAVVDDLEQVKKQAAPIGKDIGKEMSKGYETEMSSTGDRRRVFSKQIMDDFNRGVQEREDAMKAEALRDKGRFQENIDRVNNYRNQAIAAQRDIAAAADKTGQVVGKVTDALGGAIGKDAKASIDGIADSIKTISAGDHVSKIRGIADSLDHIGKLSGIDLSGVSKPIGDIANAADGVGAVAGSLKGLGDAGPGIAAGLSGVAEVVGSIAGAQGALHELHDLFGLFPKGVPDWTAPFKQVWDLIQHPTHWGEKPTGDLGATPLWGPGAPPGAPGGPPTSPGAYVPGLGTVMKPGLPLPYVPGLDLNMAPPAPAASAPEVPAPEAPAPRPPRPAPAPREPSPARIGGSSLRGLGGISDRRSLVGAGSRIANLYAFADSLVGTPYSQDLRDDCSGMVAQLAAVAVGLPPPSAGERFTTVTEADWLFSHGFRPGLGPPGSFRIGWNPEPGDLGHTAATLPGGEHAESGGAGGGFRIGAGAAGAEDPQFRMHAYLPMGRSSTGAGDMPIGTEHDPIYVTNTGPGSSDGSSQGEQLGQSIVTGMLQAVGLDGSVFKSFTGKGPLDWGATKLGMGALNWALGGFGTGKGIGGMGGAGGGGGGLPGLGMLGMIPGVGVSAAASPFNALSAPGGVTNHFHGDFQPTNFTANGVGTPADQKEIMNGMNAATNRAPAMTANMPTS